MAIKSWMRRTPTIILPWTESISPLEESNVTIIAVDEKAKARAR
jgi:putative N-acetylmannosamine-6-phosphate epimerase